MKAVYDRLSEKFEVIKLNNKVVTGKPPFNLHLNIRYKPEGVAEPIIAEIQIFLEEIYLLQNRSHRIYEINRATNIRAVTGDYVPMPHKIEFAPSISPREAMKAEAEAAVPPAELE